MIHAQKFDPSSTVHLAHRHPRGLSTFCTGRSMNDTVGTVAAVTCKSCLARAKREGIDPEENA